VAPASRIAVDRNAFVRRLDGLVVGDSARAGVFVDHRFIHPELGFAITFPKGWISRNGEAAVIAYPADESAVLVLQVAGEGNDPDTVADEVAKRVELRERSPVVTINGFPAVTAITRVNQRGADVDLALTWIAKDGLIYQVMGATTPPRWAEHRPTFEAAAREPYQP
jgi:predicted Zn-dependent protease